MIVGSAAEGMGMMDEKALKNKALAEALGWHSIEEDEWWEETRDSGPYLVKAWMGTTPDGDTERLLPDFYGSLDAATDGIPPSYVISISGDGKGGIQAAIMLPDMDDVWVGSGATRAWAVAEARLAMLEGRSASPYPRKPPEPEDAKNADSTENGGG